MVKFANYYWVNLFVSGRFVDEGEVGDCTEKVRVVGEGDLDRGWRRVDTAMINAADKSASSAMFWKVKSTTPWTWVILFSFSRKTETVPFHLFQQFE